MIISIIIINKTRKYAFVKDSVTLKQYALLDNKPRE
jgi:hypothetical protein